MKTPYRLAIVGFSLLAIIFLGLFFWPYVYNQILIPISLVVWLLLRLFVLSIDQQYYWTALILGLLLLLYRLIPREQTETEPETGPLVNETINSINMWRRLYIPGDNLAADNQTIKQMMAHWLVMMYANRLHSQADFRLYDALRSGDIPLPKHIHELAFQKEPVEETSKFRRFVRAVRNKPAKWVRHAAGQDKAEHYRMIDEMLTYLETSLEMKNDRE